VGCAGTETTPTNNAVTGYASCTAPTIAAVANLKSITTNALKSTCVSGTVSPSV